MKKNIILDNEIEFYRVEYNYDGNPLVLNSFVMGRGFNPLTFRL
jgi:hypothetical protein